MRKIILAALATVCSIGSAQAATVFTDRASFDAAVSGSTSQAFPISSANTSNLIYTFNNVTFNTTLAGDRLMIQDGLFQNAVYLATGFGGSVTISSSLNAIGLYLGSADGARSFSYNVNGTAGTFTALSSINNNGKFIGFSDTVPINIRFTTANEFDIISYVTTTNAVVPPASPVPEPASWAMMIVGAGLVGGALRRRKQQVVVRYS